MQIYFGFDQTYQWVGVKKRGRRNQVEHVDGTGMPLQIVHQVWHGMPDCRT